LTNYRVVVGPKTAFLPDFKPLRIEDFQDGTSNTILVGETQQVVLWTMPEDLPHDGAVARSGLGSHHAKGFNLLFADGSVKFAKEAKYFGAFLDAHLSPNGGEIAYEEPY
jgi:prepilin-type processing-associated H-X9-DG protein